MSAITDAAGFSNPLCFHVVGAINRTQSGSFRPTAGLRTPTDKCLYIIVNKGIGPIIYRAIIYIILIKKIKIVHLCRSKKTLQCKHCKLYNVNSTFYILNIWKCSYSELFQSYLTARRTIGISAFSLFVNVWAKWVRWVTIRMSHSTSNCQVETFDVWTSIILQSICMNFIIVYVYCKLCKFK